MTPARRRSRVPSIVALGLLALVVSACAERLPTGPSGPTPGIRPSAVVLPPSFDGQIRIGVAPTQSSVELSTDGPWEVRARSGGAAVLTGSGGEVRVTLEQPPGDVTTWRLQLACASEAGRDALLAQLEAAGEPTHTVHVPTAGCWRVYAGNFPISASFSVRNAYRLDLVARGLAPADAFWAQITINGAPALLRASSRSESAVVEGVVVFESLGGGFVRIEGQPYRGRALVSANTQGSLAGINELPLEQYLYGVVPRELSPTIWPELEALKAQAVAARTYAVRGLGKRAADGYDLLATVSDQVYGGYAAEHPTSNRAVDETASIVATHGGRLIEALFYSTSGGHTADNEEAFDSAPVPYLRGVPDAERGAAFQHASLEAFRRTANPRALRNAGAGDFEADWSSYHRWTVSWTPEEMREAVSSWAKEDVGRVLAIRDVERGPSGRITHIVFETENGTYAEVRDRIRGTLRFTRDDGVTMNLPSTLFFIAPELDRRTGEITGWTAYGGGFGHGVGLSQTGAVGMAERGRRFDEILYHYYRDIVLETLEY